MANEMFSSLPDVITAEQLASALQISKSGAYALLNRSDFPTLRIGGRKMVMKKDLLEWLKIKFTKAREKYKAEHAHDLKRFYEARRIISQKFPDGKYGRKALEAEYAEMEQQNEVTYAEFQKIRAESQQLWRIKSHIDTARKAMGYSLEHQPKKQEQEI